MAQRTLRTTTQRGMRTFLHPLQSWCATAKPHLSYLLIRKKFYMDTGKSKIPSLRGNKYFQVYTDGKKYTHFYPVKKKSDIHSTLHDFVHDLGAIPEVLVSDNAHDLTEGKFAQEARHYRI